MRVKTYLHVSDLHMDVEDEARKRRFSALARRWLIRHAGLSGILGHEAEALADLESFHAVGPPWESDEKPEVITTGDLTAVGHPLEFDKAAGFLASPPDPADPHLDAADWRRRAVAGNHDHWPGRIGWYGRFTAGLTNYFGNAARPPQPWRAYCHHVPLGSGRPDLLFLGVNTDADNPAHGSPRRVLARGSFRTALRELAGLLRAEPVSQQIRVLLLHHATRHRGIRLQIASATLTELRDFVLNFEISVLLSGHLHGHELGLPRLDAFVPRHEVLEARCGTSAQMSYILPEWRHHFGLGAVRTARHSVIVHRLLEDGKELQWGARVYERDMQNLGFPVVGPTATIKVWPRP